MCNSFRIWLSQMFGRRSLQCSAFPGRALERGGGDQREVSKLLLQITLACVSSNVGKMEYNFRKFTTAKIRDIKSKVF